MWSVAAESVFFALRVEDDDVGVGAGRDRALAREQAEDLRRRRRRELDEAVGEIRPVARRRRRPGSCASRRPARRWGSSRSRPCPAPSAPSCRTGSGRSRPPAGRCTQAAPQRVLVRLVAQRRAHDVLRALEVRAPRSCRRRGTGTAGRFRRTPAARVARLGHHLERVGRRQVDDVDRARRRFRRARCARCVASRLRRAPAASARGTSARSCPRASAALDEHVDDAAVLGVHADECRRSRRSAAAP